MTTDEICRVSKVAADIGVQKIRISGGEPLIRDDIIDVVEKITAIGFKDVALTTNGTLLGKYTSKLKSAGLNRVNVSFDTLNPETYLFITKRDYIKNAK